MLLNKNWLVFDVDGAPSGGEEKKDDKKEPEAEKKEPAPEQPGKIEFSSEQQAEVERIVKERLSREKEKGKKAEEKARQDAEAEVLKKSEEWKQLSSKYEERLATFAGIEEQLEAEKSRAARYEKVLRESLSEQMKDIPPHIKSLIEKLDVVEQMEYLQKNKEQLKQGDSGGKKPVPPSPKPEGGNQPEKDDKNSSLFYRRTF